MRFIILDFFKNNFIIPIHDTVHILMLGIKIDHNVTVLITVVITSLKSRNYSIKTFSKLKGLKANYAHHLSNLKRRCNTNKQHFLSFSLFLPIHLILRGGHQTGFSIQVQRGC